MQGVYKLGEELQRQAREYRAALYQGSPGVERFVQTRRVCLLALVGLLLLRLAVEVLLMAQGRVDFALLPQDAAKSLLHLLVLLAALAGPWQASLALYVVAVPSVLVLALSWQTVLPVAFTSGQPLLTVLFGCELLYTVGVALAALWLTLPPQSRRKAGRAREIYLAYAKYISDRVATGQPRER